MLLHAKGTRRHYDNKLLPTTTTEIALLFPYTHGQQSATTTTTKQEWRRRRRRRTCKPIVECSSEFLASAYVQFSQPKSVYAQRTTDLGIHACHGRIWSRFLHVNPRAATKPPPLYIVRCKLGKDFSAPVQKLQSRFATSYECERARERGDCDGRWPLKTCYADDDEARGEGKKNKK